MRDKSKLSYAIYSIMKFWEREQVKNYRKHLKSLRYHTEKWIANRVIEETNILYDETVNSIIPLRTHSKRSGKFDQVVFQVVYNFDLKYGYVLKLNKQFKYLKRKDLEDFKDLIGRIDPFFKGWWLKDARRFGSFSKAKGMVTVGKYRSGKIERLFGFKTAIYKKYRKGEIETQKDLSDEYAIRFNNLKIRPINF